MKVYKFTVLSGTRFAKGDSVEEAFLSMGYEGIPFEIKESKFRSNGVVKNEGRVECDGTNYSYEEVKVDKLSKREYIIHDGKDIDQVHDHPMVALQAYLRLTSDEKKCVDFFSRQWLIIDGEEEAIEVFWKYEKTNL